MRIREFSADAVGMKKMSSSEGFSLIELMVAIAILTIGMAAVGAVLYASYESSRFNAGARRAEMVAAQLTERFKAGNVGKAFSTTSNPCNCTLGTGTSGTAVFDFTNHDLDSDGVPDGHCWNPDPNLKTGVYFCQWTIADHSSGYKKLNATVYWDGAGCTRDTLSKCKRRLRILNYFKKN